jgi:hypothetical protein
MKEGRHTAKGEWFKAKHQRTEMELKCKAAEAEKLCAHKLQTLKLKIQLAQINSRARMTSMRTVGSSERSGPFGLHDTSLFGASRSSGCDTLYSTPDAFDFGSSESVSSSHNSNNDIDLLLSMYFPVLPAIPRTLLLISSLLPLSAVIRTTVSVSKSV